MAKKPVTSQSNVSSSEGSLIFRGTVMQTKASTVPDIKADGRTTIVRVDEVIAAPPTLARLAGREITVVLGDSVAAVRTGEPAVFQASGLSFGDEIAVRATRADSISGTVRGGAAAVRAMSAPLAAGGVVDPVQAHQDLLLKQSLDRADVVVAGTITQVRVADDAAVTSRGGAARMASTQGPGAAPTRISEHDPIWHEAVVNVDSVEKGTTTQRQVVVRFPGSSDVRWRDYPKLKPGQQGVFLLSADRTGRSAAGAVSSRGGAARLTALPSSSTQPAGMRATSEPQPITAIGRVRQLLGLAPSNAGRAVKGRSRPAAPKRAPTKPRRKTRRRG